MAQHTLKSRISRRLAAVDMMFVVVEGFGIWGCLFRRVDSCTSKSSFVVFDVIESRSRVVLKYVGVRYRFSRTDCSALTSPPGSQRSYIVYACTHARPRPRISAFYCECRQG